MRTAEIYLHPSVLHRGGMSAVVALEEQIKHWAVFSRRDPQRIVMLKMPQWARSKSKSAKESAKP